MIQRILKAVLGLAFVALTLFVTSLFVAAALAAGLAAWAWYRWRGRHAVAAADRPGGRVIEGEYRVVESR